MPYVKPERRAWLQPRSHEVAMDEGELQFQIACLVDDFLSDKEEIRYAVLGDVMGALSGAFAEFYRRVVAPYEDNAIERNGDVYDRLVERIRAEENGRSIRDAVGAVGAQFGCNDPATCRWHGKRTP